VDFPATYEVDGGNVVRDNAAAGSTRLAFQYGGEPCLEDGTSPTGDQVTVKESNTCAKKKFRIVLQKKNFLSDIQCII